MWFLYLDESGDLGFDFFTVCILAVRGVEHNRRILSAVKKTIRRKLARGVRPELKGARTSLEVKKHFYNQVAGIPFDIYTMTLNKRRVYDELTRRKERVYNHRASGARPDSSRGRHDPCLSRHRSEQEQREIADFNGYIATQLQGRLDPRVPLNVYHHRSTENPGLQAADLFSWGIFRKHERNDAAWFDVFRSKVRYDGRYP